MDNYPWPESVESGHLRAEAEALIKGAKNSASWVIEPR